MALEGDDVGVVHEPVDRGRGHNDVAEGSPPAVANLVDDDQWIAAQAGELGLQPPAVVGLGE